jgi:hypothetical protein
LYHQAIRRLLMKRFWLYGLFLLGLAACGTVATQGPESETPKPMPTRATFPDPSAGSGQNLGPAPELANEIWLNVDAPLRLADLRGKVVAIDMWTFG